ncbi:MAG: hypothetical protein NUV92_09475 [Ignavibacteria bacterium]|jgi:hypothetical protein|nr:hypothetical protein [Ignavibacteria bacterium]MDH7528159.1 hypothetical protein [Ignavibacteria bacterium]
MEINKISTKLYLFILILAVIFWIGGSIYRAIVAYTLFEPFSLIVKSEITYDILRQTLKLIGNINVYLLISYPIVLIFFILFLKSSKAKLRKQGWLFMTAAILFLFFPIEVYLSYLDINYTFLVLFTNFDTNIALSLLIQRIAALGGLPAIGFLSYITSIWLAIFQPLKKSSVNENQ